MNEDPGAEPGARDLRRLVRDAGLVLGPVLAVVAWLALPQTFVDTAGTTVALGRPAHATAAVAAWMATWWLTEAIDISATALLPLVLLPTLGAMPVGTVSAPYGDPLIFLFMGGFVLSLAMQRWGLHRRIALLALRGVGTRPDRLVAGFMIVTALMSMWVSNTATVLMMLPVAMSVIELAAETGGPEGERLAPALLLGLAWAASIGGLGTVIGSPPNGFFASYVAQRFGRPVSFAQWMSIGLPVMLVLLPIVWWYLTRVAEPTGRRRLAGVDRLVAAERAALGPVGRGERVTLLVFLVTAAAWITRPYLARLGVAGHRPFGGLSDAGIAMLAAATLFVVPVDWRRRVFVMDWATAVRLPWGVLILFGGGLSLAHAIDTTHIGAFIGHAVAGLGHLPPWLLTVLVATVIVFLTELTSNTATAATFIPVLASVGVSLGINPFTLMVPAALAASCAFMLPVATPPNALVFASGRLEIRSMVRAGFVVELIAVVVVSGVSLFLAGRVFGGAG